ncbi:MAG: type 1 glutamine amidotransferase [Gammaproteobacteria bacterium]|nr:type 1 glutamine amidotransferase [Gammaproteobacteria bacterium]
MTREVLIFMHMDDPNPGFIANYLEAQTIPFRIVRSYRGDVVPQLNDSISGLVFMGGSMSVNDNLPWIHDEIRLIEQALTNNIPILGHCLGGQLISRALGQPVTLNPVKEVGWHECQAIDSRENNQDVAGWLGDTDSRFNMFHWHNETFALPVDARLLFSSLHCKNQAYVYGDSTLAMQCHVEMTLPLIQHWMHEWREDLQVSTESEQSFDVIGLNLEQKISDLNSTASQLYGRWIKNVDAGS